MDIEVKEKAKAEKPKEQEYVPMIKSGVTRIYHKSIVGKMTGEGWKVK